MNMKSNILKIAVAIGLALTGCSNYLEREPIGVESSEIFFKNQDQAMQAVTAIYDATSWRFSQEIFEWFIGDIASDDGSDGIVLKLS